MPAPSNYLGMDLLRLSTAGSVDDGKSTLIGRLLFDTKSIFDDQLQAIEAASTKRGERAVNLALLTDGLRAEREQNITIDVAYRYFATPRRKFIIADTPGHIQYTRNMVTGASTAELVIVLIDARKGVLEQSKRHGFIASLLRVPHVVVAVNKMDLVGFDEPTFERIVSEYTEFAERLAVKDLAFIPISALLGDNIVARSPSMGWYDGSTLLHHLEHVNVGAERNAIDFRFPVQHVIRPHQDYRGFAGRVASGAVAAGDEVLLLPSMQTSRVRSVDGFEGALNGATTGDSVTLTLDDERDVSRGDMIVRRHNVPTVSCRIDAMVCWLAETPLDLHTRYFMLHTTQQVGAFVAGIVYRIDMNTMRRHRSETLGLNDIGRVELETANPVFFDSYALNRVTGSFVLVDPHTNRTVGAGMIRGEARTNQRRRLAGERSGLSANVVWDPRNIPRSEREARNGHKAAVVWLTGPPGSGKTTIARALERRLFARGAQTFLLDGDQLRHGLTGDLTFTREDRAENIRRAGEVARLFFEQGSIVVCSFVSPYRADRHAARSLIAEGRFIEVYVTCKMQTLRARDPKGLYAKAAQDQLANLTGVTAPYEKPEHAEIIADTDTEGAESIAARLEEALRGMGIIRSPVPDGPVIT